MGLHVEHHGGTSDALGKVVGSGAHCAELSMVGRRSLAARWRSAGEVLPPVAVNGPGGSCIFRRSVGSRLVTRRRRGHDGPLWRRRAVEGSGGGNDFDGIR
jgi:hypothetical protein